MDSNESGEGEKTAREDVFSTGVAEIERERMNVLEAGQKWVKGASTGVVASLFTLFTLLGAGRDVLEGTLGIFPFTGWVIDLASFIGAQFDESVVAVPWSVLLLELIRRWRSWRQSQNENESS